MPSISELYSLVYEKLNSIRTRYENAKSQLTASKDMDEVTRQKRIDNLKEQLEKIEEYKEKVEYFRLLAEKHLVSKNLLAITPRELNFNRLRNWAMMIDPTETENDDPYAQRIYVQAKCNEMFLQQKQEEFEKTLADLSGSAEQINQELEASVAEVKSQLTDECKAVLEDEECTELSVRVSECHAGYQGQFDFHIQTDEENRNQRIGLGFYALSFPVLDELKYFAKAKFGDYFDNRGYILMPVEYPLDNEMLLSINVAAAKEKKLYRGLQNYILNLIRSESIGTRKIYFLDALHYNNTALGALRVLEDSSAIEAIPRDSEAILDKLKEIVSGFSDIDEALGMADSVQEFNTTAPKESQIQRTVLVLIGYPSAFSGEAKNYIRRILLNYEHYGITPILVDTQYLEKRDSEQRDIPIDVVENVYRITMTQQRETISQDVGTEHHFKWYELTQELPEAFISTVRSYDTRANLLGTEYINRVDMVNYPPYVRGKKSIVLPYGVDSKDVMHSISFDNENFASYLMGASGSGKSTLLHTLITGIIRNYHPDDVELWLADFKMSEFAQYIDPMPPHVKYILLDESRELVYDLIDKLTSKMMERQRFFMQSDNRNYKKVENVPSSVYMPIIFVILDEFSIMSQAVSESEAYKLKLQNLLAKGRALGIKFIFSSQTFTKGVTGLSATAKEQIQMRIAMKNSYNEIDETLELSSGTKTEQVRNWMDALPPHFALTKYREDDKMFVKRVNVMYFAGKGDEALEPQRRLIRHLQDTMEPVPEGHYDPGKLNTYVEKKPVVVDGNSFKAFDQDRFIRECSILAEDDAYNGDEVFMFFGSPRLMYDIKEVAVTPESRQNLLLFGDSSERSCCASILTSAIRSFCIQNKAVEIWAYDRDKMYRSLRDTTWSEYEIITDMSDICNRIRSLKKSLQTNGAPTEKLIILLGFENVCADFEFAMQVPSDEGASGSGPHGDVIENLEAATVNEAEEDSESKRMRIAFLEMQKKMSEEDDDVNEDEEFIDMKSFDFDALVRAQQARLTTAQSQDTKVMEQYNPSEEKATPMAQLITKSEVHDIKSADGSAGIYNAREDLKFCVQQGSRKGVHFMAAFSSYTDLKQTGLKLEWFRHRLAFRQSSDDSKMIFNTTAATGLPEHICLYSDMLERFSFRPFLHNGLSWDGWGVDDGGKVISPLDHVE